MVIFLAFGTLLLFAVLMSDLAGRSILSTAVLFLGGGLLLGWGDLIVVNPDDQMVAQFTQLALFSVLYTDAMRLDMHSLRSTWRLPSRALGLGMPLILIGTAALAHWLVGLSWTLALLVGAILSPTDPVFAAAIVGREGVPLRLRRLLNIESGINDGLALPAVIFALHLAGSPAHSLASIGLELVLGIAIGVLIPWLTIRFVQLFLPPPTGVYRPLGAFAVALVVFGTASMVHANTFFAAFAAGVTISTSSPPMRDAFHEFGETIAELLKLFALLLFGALIAITSLTVSLPALLFALLVLVLVRPLALQLALLGSIITWQERLVAAWFGPKGFSSIFYGLLAWRAHLPGDWAVFSLVSLTIVISIVAHSSTDVVLASWIKQLNPESPPPSSQPS